MSVPSTATYNPNRARIVQLALTDVGAIGPGTVAPSQDASPLVAHANDLLAILIKSMDTDGILQWRFVRRTPTTTAGTASYAIANDVYEIDQPGRYTLSGQTTASPVTPMVRDEYMVIGDRTLTGTPIRYYAEEALDTNGIQQITLFLWPTPANTGDTFEYAAVVRARDQTADTDTLDVTQKWIRSLRYGLALDLAPGYGLPMDRIGYFQKMFEAERERCLEDDGERADIQLVPFGAYHNYGLGSRGNYR